MNVPAELLDVDFTKCPEFVAGDLYEPMLAARYEDDFPVMSWDEIDAHCNQFQDDPWLDNLVSRIFNQGSEPSCTSNATIQAHETIQAKTLGKQHVVPLSPISLYVRCGSRRSGSSVSKNLHELRTRGALPLDTPENRQRFQHVHPHRGYDVRLPSGWEATGKLLLAVEATQITTPRGFFTELCRGFPVVYGRSGHAIVAMRPLPRRRVRYANSWRASWGDGGFGYDSYHMINAGARWAFSLRTTRTQEINA